MQTFGWAKGDGRGRLEGARGLLLGMLLLVSCLYSLLARDTYGSDFRAYYVAAQVAHAGLDPYVNQVNADERFADRDWLEVNSRFIYPPSALFLFGPVSRLPYRVAKVVWGTGITLVMVWILMALSRRMPGAEWAVLGLFLSLPMASHVDNGQVDALVLGFTLVCVLARARWLGAACLGVAIAVKLSPVLVVLWLLARRRWAQAAGALAMGAALLGMGQVVYGRGAEFMSHLRGHLAPGGAMLTHTFTSFQVLYGRFVVMGSNTYSLHYVYGTRQNPLRLLGPVGAGIGILLALGYVGWVAWRQELSEEGSFFGFLAWLCLRICCCGRRVWWPAFRLRFGLSGRRRGRLPGVWRCWHRFFCPWRWLGLGGSCFGFWWWRGGCGVKVGEQQCTQ